MGRTSGNVLDHDTKSNNKQNKSISESKVTAFSVLVWKMPHILSHGEFPGI